MTSENDDMTSRKKKPTQNMFVDEGVTPQKKSPRKKKQPDPPVYEEEENSIEAETNYVDLPSKGYLGYPSHVTYRDVLVKDESRLSATTRETLNRTLNSTLKGILNNWKHYDEMSIHDRDYALLWIWANNYSSKKKASATCEHCGHEEVKEVDLTKVKVDDINPDIPIPFVIPLGEGTSIKTRPPTTGDEVMVEKHIASLPDEEKEAADYENLLMIATIDVELPMPFKRKVEWVGENVPGRVLGYVRKYQQYFKFGVHETVEHKCLKCEGVTQIQVPFQITDIIYPEPPDDFERLLQSQ